ncbi:MAG: hypothetical protein KDA99_20665, partial [Planctomycetales bacterium]|nr:hypothetical protein [Planctomycetales bacterium]
MSFVAAVRLFVIVAGTMPWPHPASAQDAQNAQATTATTPSASGDNAYQQTLLWKNQDQLVGRLLSADEKLIVWESPQFATPLRIEIPHLTHISFPLEEAASRRTDPFVIATHGQQIVYGELLALDKDQIKIRSGKHGELALKKSEVRSFRRLSNTHALYTGPNSLEDWSTLSPSRQMGQWSTTPEHHVTTKVIGAEMFRDMQLPEISQIDIELRWDRSKPGFVIAFAPPGVTRLAQKTIKLETWDNELVLQILTDSGNFEQLLTITSEMKSLYLRLLWNKQKGEFSVYDQRGRLLGKLVAEDAGGRDLTGLYIQNKGADLTVSHVRVSSWNGQVPHKVEDEISSIQKSDGTTISGKILASESTDRGITVELADGKSEVLMLDEIDSVDFGEAPEPPADPRSLQIDYFDGTLVLGQLVAISDDVAMLQTRFSSDPVRCPLHGARMLKFPEGEAPRVETVGRMELPNVTLHGTLAPVGEEESLGWKPVGAIDASRLSLDKPARIEWGLAREDGTAKIDDGDEDEAAAERREKFTDVLHLRNGDVIPCHLYGINEEEMAVETPFCDVTQIPTSAVKAIELGGNTESITRGFGNEWVVNGDKKQVDRSPNRVVFKGNANLEHELPLNGNEIAFNLKWNASAPALLNLTFKGNPQQQAPNLLIYYLSGQ